jgi:hypothetical protein
MVITVASCPLPPRPTSGGVTMTLWRQHEGLVGEQDESRKIVVTPGSIARRS